MVHSVDYFHKKLGTCGTVGMARNTGLTEAIENTLRRGVL
jgi:hypothetical protein